ncbi:MAG TPA: choice-of-anchor Q domain-containing protein [Solirubrobacter sp.]|nr:choice-of-anchor Q domain-containing protein [Solirubrobacter sp.]
MYRLARIAPLALTLSLLFTAPAFAANHAYYVQGTGDPVLGTCQPFAGVPGYFRCDSVRAAVDAANANVNSADEIDVIFLQAAGDYTVNQQLTLSDRVAIIGRGPRTTTVRGAGTARVFSVAAGTEVTMTRFGIAGGRAGGSNGGNVLNNGFLALTNMRVSDGAANQGGGIANIGSGQLVVLNSLIDGNVAGVGGGVYNTAASGLSISNSTIAFNNANGEVATGAGVATSAGGTLVSVTIARNDARSANGVGGLLSTDSANPVQLHGSLIGGNTQLDGGSANCGGEVEDVNMSNLDDGNSCQAIEISGNSGLSGALVNDGGDTDVLTISPTGAAKRGVEQCFVGTDQRAAPRAAGGVCDVGAYEQGAVAPAIDSGAFPEPEAPPTSQPPPPPPTGGEPTPTPTPTPVANQTVVAREVRGTVRVRVPGSNRFVDLDAAQGIPVGSTVDAKRGRVEITAVPRPGRPVEKAVFYDGIFRITQSRGITDLKLSEALACSKRASAAQRKPKKRRLWGDGRGRFRITGKYSAATIRGTRWLVEDRCNSTLVRVRVGAVSVRDKVRKRTVVVRAGRSYTARARRR